MEEILSMIVVPFSISFGAICAVHMMRRGSARKIKGCEYIPAIHDVIESGHRIGILLRKRANTICFDQWMERVRDKNVDDMSSIFSGDNYNVLNFIRLCHFLGCEVVVRPVADPDVDIEEDPEATSEVLTKIKKELYAK